MEFQRQISRLFDTLSETTPKTFHLPEEVVAIMLGYVKIDRNYSRDMSNFALVARAWRNPAMHFLYTHVVFASYKSMMDYYFWNDRYREYGSTARTMRLSMCPERLNRDDDICSLIKACPNIISFKVLNCNTNWINDVRVLLAMRTHWPRLTELVLHFRHFCDGDALISAVKHWPGLKHLDLKNVGGIKKAQYCRIIRLLPNLCSLRLSHQVNKQRLHDPLSNNLLSAIADTCQLLKIVVFVNCTTPLATESIFGCFNMLAHTLECLVLTGCQLIEGVTLAKIIAACDALQFVNISRSCFNDEALQYLSGNRTPRICPSIKQFAMSDCPKISMVPFRQFASVLGSHVRNGHVKSCIVYVQHMVRNLPKSVMKEIEKFNPGLKIETECNEFVIDEIMESIVGPIV